MSLSVQIGLLFALLTAFTSIVGFLYKHRGAIEAPDVEWRRPVRSSLVLFRSRWYTLGILIATASWGFHVAALSLAPISVVQSIIAGGLVLLTVVADRLFGLHVTRREWVGVALVAIGLAFLAATLGDVASEAHSSYENRTLAVWIGLGLGLGVVATALGGRSGVALGMAAGLLWGASDVTIKALSDSLGSDGIGVLIHPLAAVIALLSLGGLLVSARSLQLGPPVAVIAVTSAAANLWTIASGPIVFEEPLPDDVLGLVLRLAAFALVIIAAALTPPPVTAVEEAVGLVEPAAADA